MGSVRGWSSRPWPWWPSKTQWQYPAVCITSCESPAQRGTICKLLIAFNQRGLSEQKSKNAHFCIKRATNNTLTHQLKPNLASHLCWLYKLPEHVLRFSYIALRKEWQDYMHTSCTCTLNSCSPWGMVHIIAFLANHLLLFAPLFLQWSLFTSRISKHQTSLSLVRWLVRYSIWLLKK